MLALSAILAESRASTSSTKAQAANTVANDAEADAQKALDKKKQYQENAGHGKEYGWLNNAHTSSLAGVSISDCTEMRKLQSDPRLHTSDYRSTTSQIFTSYIGHTMLPTMWTLRPY